MNPDRLFWKIDDDGCNIFPVMLLGYKMLTRLSPKSANLSQRQNFKQSGIPAGIVGLIRIWIRVSVGSRPKCCGSITLSASVISPSFVKKNRAVTVWEMLINLLKALIVQWWGKWKSDPESVSGNGSPAKVNQFFRLVGPIITKSFNEIGSLLFE